jgi:hypothetical protein
MSTASWRFTPKEVKRAKKALTESGLEIAAVIFRKDGIEFRTKTGDAMNALDRELEDFEARHGQN